MRKQTQTFIKNFFTGVLLEGHPIQAVVINDEGETLGTSVFLITQSLHFRQVGLTFPDEWEIPTLISKEDWQAYMEASRAVAEEERLVLPERQKYYTDKVTGMILIVDQNNPRYPGHPKLTFICPEEAYLSVEAVNGAIARLEILAQIPLQYRGSSPYTLTI